MGQGFSGLVGSWAAWLFPAWREYKIVMVGLDNAGKTTVLYRLHLGEAVRTQPTVGSNVETVKADNLTFEVWDLGGQANLRPSWASYYAGADAVVLVVDCCDRGRVGVAAAELRALLGAEALAGAAVLVFANKQDLPGAMGPEELSTALGLPAVKTHNWHIQASTATTGAGLLEGMQWVARAVRVRAKKRAAGG